MKKKVDIDYKTEPMAYDTLLATVRLLKEWYYNREKVAIVKSERRDWYDTGIKCTCQPDYDDDDYYLEDERYTGTCSFCVKRNTFWDRLQEIANKQRAIKNKLRHRVKYCC